jgi:hypothetical protein
MNIIELIDKYVNKYNIGTPIYSKDICEYVLAVYYTNVNVINEYINRYEEKHDDFIRYRKGIYYRAVKTPFGFSKIDYNKLINDLYLCDIDQVYGYISGPTLANKIGLTTQMAKEEYIVTNNNRVVSDIDNIKLIKPPVIVTRDNYKILQVLDLLLNKYDVYYDCENPNKVIYNYIVDNNINFENLLYYSKYYNKNVLFKLQEVCCL